MISYTQHSGSDVPHLDNLLEASEQEGFRFLRRLINDWQSGANRFDAQGEMLIACTENDKTIAVGGLNLDPYSDDPQIGRIRHVYVDHDHRRRGIGRCLVDKLIAHARNNFRAVRLRTNTPSGDQFYQSLGFSLLTNHTTVTHVRRI